MFFCYLFVTTANAQNEHYDIVDAQTINADSSVGTGINGAGELTGYYRQKDLSYAYIYRYDATTQAPAMLDLNAGSGSSGNAINIHQQIAGFYGMVDEGALHGYASFFSTDGLFYDPSNGLTRISPLGFAPPVSMEFINPTDEQQLLGNGINDNGVAVGISSYNSSAFPPPAHIHAATYDSKTAADLDKDNAWDSAALSINDFGSVVGTIGAQTSSYAGVFSPTRKIFDTGTFSSAATSINNYGDIVGFRLLFPACHSVVFLGLPKNSTDIPAVGRFGDDIANSINNTGEIVGSYRTAQVEEFNSSSYSPQDYSAYVYNLENSGETYDLSKKIDSSFGWNIYTAQAVNDAGQITGTGLRNGYQHAYLATPFFRQADATPHPTLEVPSCFGNKLPLTNMAKKGCRLCSLANAARSLIALNPIISQQQHIREITPAYLDTLLKANNGYHNHNDIDWDHLLPVFRPYAKIQRLKRQILDSYNYSQLDNYLAKVIYEQGRRIVLSMHEYIYSGSTLIKESDHAIWVIGKSEGDWHVADPGWNNFAQPTFQADAGSLMAHFTGLTTAGDAYIHKFTPEWAEELYNLDYKLPSSTVSNSVSQNPDFRLVDDDRGIKNQSSKTFKPDVAVSSPVPITVGVIADNNVEIEVTDPQGHRLGRDSITGNDYSEILNGTYTQDNSNPDIDGDTPSVQYKNASIVGAVPGTYSITLFGAQATSSNIRFDVVGSGGSARTSDFVANFEDSNMLTYKVFVPEPSTVDIAVTQAISSDTTPQINSNVIYNVTIKNTGTTGATSLHFVDTLPTGADFVSASLNGKQYSYNGGFAYGDLPDLPADGSLSLEIVVSPTTSGAMSNEIHVTSFEQDSNEDNNVSVSSVTIGTSVELPSVSLQPKRDTAYEAGREKGFFVVTRTGNTSNDLAVHYVAKGSAKSGVQYKSLSDIVTIPAGSQSAKINVKPLDDHLVAQDTKVKIKLIPDPAYALGNPSKATVKIIGK